MGRIEDTCGNVTYTIPNCDCGLTGGCDKCQSIFIPKETEIDTEPCRMLRLWQSVGG